MTYIVKSMSTFSSITIIFNPNSTGESKAAAEELKGDLGKFFSGPIDLIATQYAGHAEELAGAAVGKGEAPLIISSSGDGGYQEVINGVMAAGRTGAICAVLPAGNANDHAAATQRASLVELIERRSIKPLDLLSVTTTGKTGPPQTRFAHSYVGLGLTPTVAVELNRHTLSTLKELVIVLKTFWQYQPFQIQIEGRTLTLDSVIMSNINRMAKVMTLDEESSVSDGVFEVNIFKHSHKIRLLAHLLKAATRGLSPEQRVSQFAFTTLKPIPMQLDGEVQELPAATLVTITSKRQALQVIR